MKSYLVLILFFIAFAARSQEIRELDSLLAVGKASLAKEKLQDKLAQLIGSNQYQALPENLEVYGRIQAALTDDMSATASVESKIKEWGLIVTTPHASKELWLSASSWYEYVGKYGQAEKAKAKALDFARKEPTISSQELGELLVSLAGYSINKMDLSKAKIYLKEAQELLENDPEPESIYRLNSYFGNMAYFASKFDSAEYYYKKCLEAFKKMEPTLRNTHYRPSLILNNLSGVQSAQGKSSEAINSMNQVISLLQYYLDKETDPALKMRAREFYFQALDNLGGVYKSLGNFAKAQDLLEFAYQKKQEELSSESKDIWFSEILLGQLYYDQMEYEKGRKMLLSGLRGLENTDGNYALYEADGWYALGRIEDIEGNEELAEKYYRLTHRMLKEGLEDYLDLQYLGFLKNFSKFLAENKKGKEAISLSNEAYDYILRTAGKNSLIAFEQELTLGEVYLDLQEYNLASKWSEIALQTLENQGMDDYTLLDSIRNDRFKPHALLLKNKSRFLANANPSMDELKEIVASLEDGLKIIERNKIYLESEDDLSLLLNENDAYFSFLEKIYLELYKKSPDQNYLSKLLLLHESALYQKIRMRMDRLNLSGFGSIPKDFFAQEELFKAKIKESISNEEDDIQAYQQAVADWEEFLASSRKKYPEYYEFRYASLLRPMEEVWSNISSEQTVIRYLIIEDRLIALVLKCGDKKIALYELDFNETLVHAKDYQNHWKNEAAALANLHSLYTNLWKPFASQLTTSRVTVVPDGFLFNLNFELLTPEILDGYEEFASGSLLADYSFSYNYSTLLFKYPANTIPIQSNFVGFAPGFFDDMKSSYLSAVKDSFRVDYSYLKLIPQPFTEQLLEGLEDQMNGTVYSKQMSTLEQFSKEAGKHRIIHIGTHAESNNLTPEFSRLIFAKNGTKEENSLYAKDIYAMDLSSELAVLMACETGKPTYQPGEGMISLAHAFNYAGSKSLLTGLWKIDEEASTKIAENFYRYIAQGMQKDESLRLAKLDYLASANGRALSPEFWAGLILIGNADKINLESSSQNLFIYIALSIVLLLVLSLLYSRNKK